MAESTHPEAPAVSTARPKHETVYIVEGRPGNRQSTWGTARDAIRVADEVFGNDDLQAVYVYKQRLFYSRVVYERVLDLRDEDSSMCACGANEAETDGECADCWNARRQEQEELFYEDSAETRIALKGHL